MSAAAPTHKSCSPAALRARSRSFASCPASGTTSLPGFGSARSTAEVETDAIAAVRPRRTPDAATLTSGVFTSAAVPTATKRQFLISLNGYTPQMVDLGTTTASGGLVARLNDLADRIQTAVRNLKSVEAYKKFECTVNPTAGQESLILSHGNAQRRFLDHGQRRPPPKRSLALAGSSTCWPIQPGRSCRLTRRTALAIPGSDGTFDPADYATFIGDQTARTGLYALRIRGSLQPAGDSTRCPGEQLGRRIRSMDAALAYCERPPRLTC